MKKIQMTILSGFLLFANSISGATVTTSSDGAITIGVFASSAPNISDSPSWGGYATNAMSWLQNGGTFGDPSISPIGYVHATPKIPAGDITISNFNSWRGTALPSAPFDGEFGNRVHFGLSVIAEPGVTFMLSNVTHDVTSSEGNSLGLLRFTNPNSSSINSFTPTRIGIDTNGNQITSGSATGVSLIALYYIGESVAYSAYGAGSEQQKLQNIEDYVNSVGGVDVTGTYSVTYSGTKSGTISASDTVAVIPEPTVVLLGSLGVFALLRRRRS